MFLYILIVYDYKYIPPIKIMCLILKVINLQTISYNQIIGATIRFINRIKS